MVRAPIASALPDTPACLDIEASGFGRDSYPIEIGYVLADGSAWCTLVRPAPGWTHWDEAAQAVHGITPQALQRHGRDVAEVAATLNRQLRGLTLYCDGWAHDYAWLNRLFDEADIVPAFRLDSLRSTLDDAQAAAWHTTQQAVALEMQATRHRASTDAKLLQLTWQRLHATAA